MHIHSSLMECQFDKECSSDLGSYGGAASHSHEHDHLNKCLRLIVYFLDVHIFNAPSPDTREAWKIMTDTIRRICLQGCCLPLLAAPFVLAEFALSSFKGAEKCLQSIVELWHNDRKRWWPCFRLPRSGIPPTLAPDDAEFFSNKGFVCYILESNNHPFVAGLMDHGELRLLKSLIKETSHNKLKLDENIERLLRANKPLDRVPLISPTEVLQSNLTGNKANGFSSKFQSIDSKQKAKDFAQYLKTTKPIKPKEEYKSAGKIHASTIELLKLPIDELLAKRYEKRRKLRLQSRKRQTNSSPNNAPKAGCSQSTVDSSSFQLDLSKCNIDGAKVGGGSSKQDDRDGHETLASSVCKNIVDKAVNVNQIVKNLKVYLSKPSISEPSTSENPVACNTNIKSEDQTRVTNNTLMKTRTLSNKCSKAKTSSTKIGKEELATCRW